MQVKSSHQAQPGGYCTRWFGRREGSGSGSGQFVKVAHDPSRPSSSQMYCDVPCCAVPTSTVLTTGARYIHPSNKNASPLIIQLFPTQLVGKEEKEKKEKKDGQPIKRQNTTAQTVILFRWEPRAKNAVSPYNLSQVPKNTCTLPELSRVVCVAHPRVAIR